MKAKLYTKENCAYCTQAKSLLTSLGIEYDEINVANQDTKTELLAECAKINVIPKTVPQIWLDDVYVGGYTELYSQLCSKVA